MTLTCRIKLCRMEGRKKVDYKNIMDHTNVYKQNCSALTENKEEKSEQLKLLHESQEKLRSCYIKSTCSKTSSHPSMQYLK